jgi:hypothetical protein
MVNSRKKGGNMKKILVLFIVTLFFSLTCCKKSEPAHSIETIDGIEFVHNTRTPLYPEKTLEFVEDLFISPENDKGEILLYLPNRCAVNEEGNIYIGDYQDSSIKVFDPQGKYIKTIGRKGNGPGEFQTIGELSFLPDGRFLVMDWGQRRISFFSADDQFIASHNFQNSSFDLFLTSSSSYVREETLVEPGAKEYEFKRRLFIRAYDLSGKESISYGEFTARQSGFINDPDGRFSYSLPYFVYSILAGDNKNERLYHCLNDKYVIDVYDKNGKIIRKIDRPYEPVPTTAEDMKRYVDGFGNSSEKHKSLIEKFTKMPTFKTVTERMIVDDVGNLWVETNELREEKDSLLRAYDIFNEDGMYVYKVWLERAPGLFKGEHMYRLERDEETDYRFLKRYRVIWSN